MTVRSIPALAKTSRVETIVPVPQLDDPTSLVQSDTGTYFKMQNRSGDPAGFMFFAQDWAGGTLFRYNGSTWTPMAKGLGELPQGHGHQHSGTAWDPGSLLSFKTRTPAANITINQNAAQSLDAWAGTTGNYEITFTPPAPPPTSATATFVLVRLNAYCKVATGKLMWAVQTKGNPLGAGTDLDSTYQHVTSSANNTRVTAEFKMSVASLVENTLIWRAKMDAVSTSGSIEAGDPVFMTVWLL